MKTLEEVKAHVNVVGYSQSAIDSIEGFLIGKDMLSEDTEIEYMIGDKTFFDFKTWFDSEVKNKSEIDWSEFGFGDFIHVQEGIDVVLLGGIHDENIVCINDRCEVKCLLVTNDTRPCNEEEIKKVVKRFNANGLNFCFVDNEFKPYTMCNYCAGCKEETENSKEIDELNKSYKELCEIADSMSEDNPFKSVAKTIVESLGKMVDEVKEVGKEDSELIDELEIDAKEAIENIIANIHAGTMDEKEKGNVISALRGLVELGNMYE